MDAKRYDELAAQLPERLKSRVGYVESAHPDEIVKGAQIAAAILREELLKASVLQNP